MRRGSRSRRLRGGELGLGLPECSDLRKWAGTAWLTVAINSCISSRPLVGLVDGRQRSCARGCPWRLVLDVFLGREQMQVTCEASHTGAAVTPPLRWASLAVFHDAPSPLATWAVLAETSGS
jgi:hypothetical protein